MRRLRGKRRVSNSETNRLTEARELRSSDMTTISESGFSDTMRALASSAAFKLLAGNISLAPRFANTRAVSAPIPDVAPYKYTQTNQPHVLKQKPKTKNKKPKQKQTISTTTVVKSSQNDCFQN